MRMKKLFFLVIIVCVIIGIRFSPLACYFTFENLQQQKENLQSMVENHYLLSSFLYIILYCFSVALSIPGAAILTMAGGFLFGLIAVVYVNIGATTGAVGAFLVARYLLGSYFQERYAHKLQRFNRELQDNGPSYLLTLRLIPIFPFFLINVAAGLTTISLHTFAWTTAVGIIPGSFLFVFAGRQLETISKPSDILSYKMLIVLLVLAALALLPVLANKFKKKFRS